MKKFKIVNTRGQFYVYKRFWILPIWEALNTKTTWDDELGDFYTTHHIGFDSYNDARRYADLQIKHKYYV